MRQIATVTMNPAIDKSASVSHVAPDRKLRCGPPRFDPGGGGVNVSRVVATLGGETTAWYPCGGPTGSLYRQLCEDLPINHHPLPIEGWTRENFIAVEEASDRLYRFGMPGPELSEPEWRQFLDELSRLDPTPAFVVASGSLPRGVPSDFYARLSRAVRGHGIRVVVDASGDALRAAVDEGVDLIKPNLRELGQLAGRELEDENDQEAFAEELVGQGRCGAVVVSLGAAGCLAVSREGRFRQRSPSVTIRSTVGAGDSMTAGIVLGLARGDSLRDAVRLGVSAGAAAVTTPGTELCRREETERLLSRMSADP